MIKGLVLKFIVALCLKLHENKFCIVYMVTVLYACFQRSKFGILSSKIDVVSI